MSRIKLYLLGFITLCTTIAAWGQDQITRPRDCIPNASGKNPGGNTIGGNFFITPIPACLGANGEAVVIISDPKPPSGTFDPGILYEFNYREVDGDLDFTTATASNNEFAYTQEGTYWIAVNGKQGSTSFITCKSAEVVNPKVTEVDFDFCTPLNVKLEIKNTPDNVKQGGVRIEWGDGNSNEYIISSYPYTIDHNYNPSNPPTSDIKVEGMYLRNGSPISGCNSIPATLPITPILPKISELEGLNGGTENIITMKDGNPGTIYNIEMSTNNGTWTPTSQTIQAPTAGNTSSVTITGLNATNEYCFRLSKAGACATSIESNKVCTIKPTHNVLSAEKVQVDWTTAQGNITRYEVVYKESPTGFNQNSGSTQPSEKTFTFDQMDCSVKYEFQINGIVGGGALADRVIIKSPTFIVQPLQGGRVPFENLLVVSTAINLVRINTLYPFPKTNIYRAEGNSTNFQKVTTLGIDKTDWQDLNVETTKQQYCYKVDYEDECSNISEESPIGCTVFLTSAQSNTLNWTPFSIIDPSNLLQDVKATTYTIDLVDESGGLVGSPIGQTLQTEAEIKNELDQLLRDPLNDGKVIVRVTAKQESKILWEGAILDFPWYSFSNTYTFITPAQVYFPSAFTPNDDGKNDLFEATGKYIAEFNMIIYDRWGAPIFESKDITQGWDGKENGQPAPTGYYSFKIFGIDNAGQEFSKVGSVLLMK